MTNLLETFEMKIEQKDLHGGIYSTRFRNEFIPLGLEFIPLGLEMNANHIRSTRQGHVRAFASLIHQGKTTQVWNIDIKDDHDQLISVMRGTIAIKPIQ